MICLKQEEDLRQFAKFPEMVELLDDKAQQVMTRSRRWKQLLEKISQGNKNFTNLIKKFGSAVKHDNLAKVQRVVTVLSGNESSASSSTQQTTGVTTGPPEDPNDGLDEDEDEDETAEADTKGQKGEEASNEEDKDEGLDEDEDESEEEDGTDNDKAKQEPQQNSMLAPIRAVADAVSPGASTTSQMLQQETSTPPSKPEDSTPKPGRLGIDNDSVEDDDAST